MKMASFRPAERILLLMLLCLWVTGKSEAKPSFLQKKKYTPLIFFTAPKHYSPECDEMEKIVSQVERETGLRVERMDVVRDPTAKAILSQLTSKELPYLYNRETLQTIWVPNKSAIDKTKVRAWAKGRLVTSMSMSAGKTTGKPVVVSGQSSALDQDQLQEELLDSTLGPVQQKGRKAIKKKTAEMAKESAR